MFRSGCKIGHAGSAFCIGERFRPRFAAVGGLEESARFAGNRTPKRSSDHHVGIFRIDDDRTDEMFFQKSGAGPSRSPVSGLENAMAPALFAGRNVNDVGIRSSNGDGPAGPTWPPPKNRLPGPAAITAFPNPAIGLPTAINLGLPRNPTT